MTVTPLRQPWPRCLTPELQPPWPPGGPPEVPLVEVAQDLRRRHLVFRTSKPHHYQRDGRWRVLRPQWPAP